MRTPFAPAAEHRGAPFNPFRLIRAVATIALTAAAASALTGCTRVVTFDRAEFASDPACAEVIVRLPEAVADESRRETDAQATGAWGDPASVLLRCGVPVPGPTTERCVSVNGIDWIIDETRAPSYRFTTYGRTPAIEVVLDYDVVSGETALNDLSSAISAIPPDGACTGVGDIDG